MVLLLVKPMYGLNICILVNSKLHSCMLPKSLPCILAYLNTFINAYLHICILKEFHTCTLIYIFIYKVAIMHATATIVASLYTCLNTYINAYLYSCILPYLFTCTLEFLQTCKKSGTLELSSRIFLEENPDIFQKSKILRHFVKICFHIEKIKLK